jgi:cytochrome c oxidase cbb3-type subunit 4
MTYESVAKFVQQGDTVFFVLMFAVVLVYAFWPKNREKFEKAARAALDAEE